MRYKIYKLEKEIKRLEHNLDCVEEAVYSLGIVMILFCLIKIVSGC